MKELTKPKNKKSVDYGLLVVVFILIIVGLYILYSTSSYNGRVKFDDDFYYLKKQALRLHLASGVCMQWQILIITFGKNLRCGRM